MSDAFQLLAEAQIAFDEAKSARDDLICDVSARFFTGGHREGAMTLVTSSDWVVRSWVMTQPEVIARQRGVVLTFKALKEAEAKVHSTQHGTQERIAEALEALAIAQNRGGA